MAYVVIGGGIAGVCCAQTLLTQQNDHNLNVILITTSSVVKSAGTLKQVSQVISDFTVDEKTIDNFAAEFPGLKVIQDEVINIYERKKFVLLSDGEKIHYVKLSVCTGARPAVISNASNCVLGIRDTETVQDFQHKLSTAKRVVIVGNGGIALELVFKIKNCEVIWVIKDKHIGTTFLDPGASEFLIRDFLNDEETSDHTQVDFRRFKYTVHDLGTNSKGKYLSANGSALGPDWHENLSLHGLANISKSIIIEYETEVEKIVENDKNLKSTNSKQETWPASVALMNGKVYECDFIISATGTLPNTQIFTTVDNCHYGVNGGVKVDDNFRVIGCSDIYSAGDVCHCSWACSPQWQQMRLWTQARQMGIICGLSMISHYEKQSDILLDICFDLFAHVTKFFGHKVVLLGKFNGQGLPASECELIVRYTRGVEYIKVLLHKGRMYGAVLIGETDMEETFENLILNEMDLTVFGENLLHPDIDITDYFD